MCPVLALVIYFTIFSISGTKDTALFLGKNQYKQFSKNFELILTKYGCEIKSDFGVDVKHLGVHLLRKGAVQIQHVDHLTQLQISEKDGQWVRFRICTYNLK